MIAIDAMGGDFAPKVAVQGAIAAARKHVSIALFGNRKLLESLLTQLDSNWHTLPLSIIHCEQTILMAEEPTRSVLKKQDASLVRAVQSVMEGQSSAVVSAGNSGAALVASTLSFGRVPGVLRPALGNFLPTPNGSLFCIDLGATTEGKPEYLLQYAFMGHLYVQKVLGINEPRVALLSNGHEPYKGSSLIKQAYALLEQTSQLNFVGNVEARDIFDGYADVLVSDGYSGNIMLKTAQGTAKAITTWLKQEAAYSWKNKVALACSSGIFKRLQQKTDYASRGGALLLGLTKPMIIAHGCSNAQAIEQAILFAYSLVREKFIASYNQELERLIAMSNIPSEYTVNKSLERQLNP